MSEVQDLPNNLRPVQFDDRILHAWQEVRAQFGGELLGSFTEGGRANVLLAEGAPGLYVVKIPRHVMPHCQPWLAKEANTLSHLESKRGCPLRIPRLLAAEVNGDRTPYMVQTFVPGHTFTESQIAELPITARQNIGKRLGEFIVWMRQTIDYDEYVTITNGLSGPPRPNRATSLPFQNSYAGPELAKRGYTALADFLDDLHETYQGTEQLNTPSNSIGHNDIYANNITFTYGDDGWRLCGVIDFGLTRPNSIEEELRFLPQLGDVVLRAAIEHVAATGTEISLNGIDFWAKTGLALACTHYLTYVGSIPSMWRTALKQTAPDIDWSELDQPTQPLRYMLDTLDFN